MEKDNKVAQIFQRVDTKPRKHKRLLLPTKMK